MKVRAREPICRMMRNVAPWADFASSESGRLSAGREGVGVGVDMLGFEGLVTRELVVAVSWSVVWRKGEQIGFAWNVWRML